MDSLKIQSMQAADFIRAAWPDVRERAREIMHHVEDLEAVILCGCGDSHHAALNLQMAFGLWSGRRPIAASAMQTSRYLLPFAVENPDRSLLIGISASGEVARTIEAVEAARRMGFRTLAITGAPESSLAEASDTVLPLTSPTAPFGPGVLSYLASILSGLAVVDAWSPEVSRNELSSVMEDLPVVLENWQEGQEAAGERFAEEAPDLPIVFLGSGPAFGSALFSAAKVIESTGRNAWGQDVEEWAHLEYFCDPAPMPTWLLGSSGRSLSRENEVVTAAQTIGRTFMNSRFLGKVEWTDAAREAVSPLCLWAGPAAFAARRALKFGTQAFRGFEGGRSREEGGGVSRIRTSRRILP